ncbi:MAG TPA: hypothetical protein VLA29_08215 [Acidimicrobiia bacterium]|nr:hypothetical protein [Acidimicrobiia bacterium]
MPPSRTQPVRLHASHHLLTASDARSRGASSWECAAGNGDRIVGGDGETRTRHYTLAHEAVGLVRARGPVFLDRRAGTPRSFHQGRFDELLHRLDASGLR